MTSVSRKRRVEVADRHARRHDVAATNCQTNRAQDDAPRSCRCGAVQRGNDRQPCFFREVVYLHYLQDLREAAMKFDCRVPACVSLSYRVRLLVTPGHAGMRARIALSHSN